MGCILAYYKLALAKILSFIGYLERKLHSGAYMAHQLKKWLNISLGCAIYFIATQISPFHTWTSIFPCYLPYSNLEKLNKRSFLFTSWTTFPLGQLLTSMSPSLPTLTMTVVCRTYFPVVGELVLQFHGYLWFYLTGRIISPGQHLFIALIYIWDVCLAIICVSNRHTLC